MKSNRCSVWQHLVVDAIVETGATLSVRLRDRAGQRNFVNYLFLDRMERLLHREQLEFWRTLRTPLTYVRTGGEGVLVDDEALFWQAFA